MHDIRGPSLSLDLQELTSIVDYSILIEICRQKVGVKDEENEFLKKFKNE
jgi:hypothetical protein